MQLRGGKASAGALAEALDALVVTGGGYCERAYASLLALPSVAEPTREESNEQKRRYLEDGSALPEPVQRCLTAYGLNHQSECEALQGREQMQAASNARAAGKISEEGPP